MFISCMPVVICSTIALHSTVLEKTPPDLSDRPLDAMRYTRERPYDHELNT